MNRLANERSTEMKEHDKSDRVGSLVEELATSHNVCSNVFVCVWIVRWRSDGRCGTDFAILRDNNDAEGIAAECDPRSERPCCSDFGYCGISRSHCACKGCVDYRSDYFIVSHTNHSIDVLSVDCHT